MFNKKFEGDPWLSIYHYGDGQYEGRHLVSFEAHRRSYTGLRGTSLPQEDGSELTFRLRYNLATQTLTGTWQEHTSSEGYYRGQRFHGAVQFIINGAFDKASGLWVGFNSDLTQVNSGEWTLERPEPSV